MDFIENQCSVAFSLFASNLTHTHTHAFTLFLCSEKKNITMTLSSWLWVLKLSSLLWILDVFITFSLVTLDTVTSRYSDVKWQERGVACGDRGPGCAQGLLFISPHPDFWSPATLVPRWTLSPHHLAAWVCKQGDPHIPYGSFTCAILGLLTETNKILRFKVVQIRFAVQNMSFSQLCCTEFNYRGGVQSGHKLKLYDQTKNHTVCMYFVFQVRGLCGTLTWNQHDDFTTPEGDVENSVSSFVGKFTSEHCSPPGGPPPDSCTTYTQRRYYAETVCSIIHSPVFQVVYMECDKSQAVSGVSSDLFPSLLFTPAPPSIIL